MSAGLLLALEMMGGCATVLEGTSQSIAINTTPVGASCQLVRSGQTIGKVDPTPGSVLIQKSHEDIDVQCKKPGYQDAAAHLKADLAAATFGNILAGGVVGVIVDASNAANVKYDGNVNISMLAAPPSSAPQPAAPASPAPAPNTSLQAIVAARSVDPAESQTLTHCISATLDALYYVKAECGSGGRPVSEADAQALIARHSAARVAQTSTSSADAAPFKPAPVGTRVYLSTGGHREIIAVEDMVTSVSDSSGRYYRYIAGFVSPNAGSKIDREKLEKLWPLEVGKKVEVVQSKEDEAWDYVLTVARKETVQVPAGKFDAFVIEWNEVGIRHNHFEAKFTDWYAPIPGVIVKEDFRLVKGDAGYHRSWEAVEITVPEEVKRQAENTARLP